MNKDNFIKGRGAQIDPDNKYQINNYIIRDDEAIDSWEKDSTATQYFSDTSKSIVNKVKSPDIRMMYSLNPYQGCEHGCIYCYARNSHEYWGYSAGLDFESRIMIKHMAPQLLRQFFNKKNWQPTPISLSGNTDCYQPIERKMGITRALLKVFLEYRNPVGIITKNNLILRDLDILKQLAERNLVKVYFSITSVDEQIRSFLEPRTSTYKNRFNVMEKLSREGIATGVMNAPLIPGLNDMHMHEVLKNAANAGAKWAGYTIVRLNGQVKILFQDWLFKAFPEKAKKIWNQIESCHGGTVNDSRFGTRIVGEGAYATLIKNQFEIFCRKYKLNDHEYEWNTTSFIRKYGDQLELFK